MRQLEGPLSPTERISTLDILRGFALIGILIMNMPGFGNSFFAEADGSHLWPGPSTGRPRCVRDTLFSGKFNSMFSLLFGIGFTIQFARMQQLAPGTPRPVPAPPARAAGGRACACPVFWTGDVLHIYALLGLLLVFALRHASDRMIIGADRRLRALSGVSGVAARAGHHARHHRRARRGRQGLRSQQQPRLRPGYASSTWRGRTARVHLQLRQRWSLWGTLGCYVQMATTMLIGLLVGRHRLGAAHPRADAARSGALTWWALAVGLACGLAFSSSSRLPRARSVADQGAGQPLLQTSPPGDDDLLRAGDRATGAAARRGKRRLAPLAAAGRMPLTNYLMQTAICTTLFYGWGFGLWGKVGPAAGWCWRSAIFFAVQVPWSVWWLRRHERGPLEYAWRVLTYGRMRFKPVTAAAG